MTYRSLKWQAMIWAGLVVFVALLAPIQALRGKDASDFVSFYGAAQMIKSGQAQALYQPSTQAQTQAAVLGHPLNLGLNVYRNPPLAGWLLQPLTSLSLWAALLVFTLLSVCALGVALWLLLPLLPVAGAGFRLGLSTATAILLPLTGSIAFGNWDGFLFLSAAAALRRLALRGDSWLAGALLGICGVKPQMVWLVLPALLLARGWRTAGGFALAGVVWLLSFPVIAGFMSLRDWLGLLGWYPGEVARTHGVPGILASFGVPAAAALLLPVLGALAALLTIGLRWHPRLPAAMVIGLAISSVVSPHTYVGDISVGFGLATLWLARWNPRQGFGIAVLLGLLWLLPGGGRWVDAGGLLLLGGAAVICSRHGGLLHSDLT